MKLSVIIPAYNEEESISCTVNGIKKTLKANNIIHEIIIINDNSVDATIKICQVLSRINRNVKIYSSPYPRGFGNAVRYGLDKFSGDCVAIMMADASDSPDDLVRYYNTMTSGDYDCVFGNRFSPDGKVKGYPLVKLAINRTANHIISRVMRIKYKDSTNAFKLYNKKVIKGVSPLISSDFNLTIEIPLKAMIRGYTYTIVPNSWDYRKSGESSFKVRHLFNGYFFTFIYCFIEYRLTKKVKS